MAIYLYLGVAIWAEWSDLSISEKLDILDVSGKMVLFWAQRGGTHKPLLRTCTKILVTYILFDVLGKSDPPPRFRAQGPLTSQYVHISPRGHASHMHDHP